MMSWRTSPAISTKADTLEEWYKQFSFAVYEILNAPSFNVSNTLYSKVNKSIITYFQTLRLWQRFNSKKELNRGSTKLDMDHFHDMIRTAEDDEILKVHKSSALQSGKYHEHNPSDTWGASNQFSQAIIALNQYSCFRYFTYCFSLSIPAY